MCFSNVSSTKLLLPGVLLLPCTVGTQIRIFVWEEPPKKPILAISMWDEWLLPVCVFKVSNKPPSFRDHELQCAFLWRDKVLGFALSLKPLQQKATVKKGSPKRWCHGEGSGRPCGQAEDRTEQTRVCGLLGFPLATSLGIWTIKNTILFVSKSASYYIGSVVRSNTV